LRLLELISKQQDVDKATLKECGELEDLSGKTIEEIASILATSSGIAQASFVLMKRTRPELTLDEVRESITLENYAEIGWELYFAYSELDREQIKGLRERLGKGKAPENPPTLVETPTPTA